MFNLNCLKASAVALFLFSAASHPVFGMEGEDNTKPVTVKKVVIQKYLPAGSSQEYIGRASELCTLIMEAPQLEILHDGRDDIPANTVVRDYGWSFRPNPVAVCELLEFCHAQKSTVRGIEVGPGHGYEASLILLTKRVQLTAYEKQSKQCVLVRGNVLGTMQGVDPTVAWDKIFYPKCNDFIDVKFGDKFEGQYALLNANKVVHFLDPVETDTFFDKVALLLKPGGRLFLTAVTPKPKSKFEAFIEKQKGSKYPGYVFYRQENRLNAEWTDIVGEPDIVLVRAPSANEKCAHFMQSVRQVNDDIAFSVTDRVMHYHTGETLTNALGKRFRVLKLTMMSPDEIGGNASFQEDMIHIVAERVAEEK